MSAARTHGDAACVPFFLDDGPRRLFAVHHAPGSAGHVLCALPFNEEMNRCRSMVTLQARALAKLGLGTLVVDPFGTGDSQGEHGDARWSAWADGLRRAVQWLDEKPGGCKAILGIRLGAILAAEVHRDLARPQIALALWQPVTNGKAHLTQFLRVRIAAQMDRPNAVKETTAAMRERFAANESVEVAGYEIHPELAAAIDAATLAGATPAAGARVLWLESSNAEEAKIAPASEPVLEEWRRHGVAVDAEVFAGPAFWQLHERTVAPAAIDATARWLGALHAQR